MQKKEMEGALIEPVFTAQPCSCCQRPSGIVIPGALHIEDGAGLPVQ